VRDVVGLIVDIETTGLTEHDEIIELALILFSYDPLSGDIGGILDRYVGLREPNVPCSPGALQVHKITADLTRGKVLNEDKVRSLFDRAEAVFAHNAQFDKGFLFRLFPDLPEKPWLCTMRDIVWDWEGFLQVSLDAICEHYRIERNGAHRAYEDAITVLSVLHRNNCQGTPHIKQLHERLHRPAFSVSFVNSETNRLRKLVISDQNNEFLARGGDDLEVRLWTTADYDFINGYLRGSVGGSGRVFQFEKSKNRKLLDMISEDRHVTLKLVGRVDQKLRFNITVTPKKIYQQKRIDG